MTREELLARAREWAEQAQLYREVAADPETPTEDQETLEKSAVLFDRVVQSLRLEVETSRRHCVTHLVADCPACALEVK